VVRTLALLLVLLAERQLNAGPIPSPQFQVPRGFVVEKVAGPPLVRYPLFAAFDDRGRLFVAEGTGTNFPGDKLVQIKRGRILVLEDTGGDGKFDTSRVFADGLVFPTGVLWHDGVLYATSHPSLWRFEDDRGRSVRRQALVSRFNFNGNGCDIHGPFLGPDGWLYWTDGRHGYKVPTREGPVLEGFASRVWRCRTDGTGIERICGGGFDNPVELAFTAEGDLIGTMDQGPGDALLHYIEGGVYPMEHPCLKEFLHTGLLLGSIRQYTAALPVALCGLTRYRSGQFGKEFQGCLFSAQFNVHRLQRHTLVRDGATFRSVESDFFTSDNHDVHLTDVLEDADGSLLVVDMGAWFNYGCPTSKIARPEVLGAIYRVRRADAPKVVDPWGKALKLATRSAGDLAALLDDPRPRVRDQVITQLARRGQEAVPALAGVLRNTKGCSVQARRNAVWALCRLRLPEAQAAIRVALEDRDASVRQAAAHAAGLEKDARAGTALMRLVVKDTPSVRLKAAEGLGRIGRPQAVPALLDSLRQGPVDRFLEHALVYALIRLNDRRATLPALKDPSPRVRQAGLLALDQMKDGGLTREMVVPLLDTDDPNLQQAVLAVISRHPAWASDVLGLLRRWLDNPRRPAGQERSLTGALLAFSGTDGVQKLVAEVLSGSGTPTATRLLLLGVVARCRVEPLPKPWSAVLGQALEHPEPAVRREAVAVVRARNLRQFDRQLAALGRQKNLPAELRVAALDCLAGRQGRVEAEVFQLLTGQLSGRAEPLQRVAAARALGASTLDRRQLLRLADQVAAAGPMVLPLLVPAYGRGGDAEVGRALVAALNRSPGLEALNSADLDRLLRDYPAEVQQRGQSLRDRLAARRAKQAAYLARLSGELAKRTGSAERGRRVFFAKKVACYTCHRAANDGGAIGPDLSRVGRFRSRGDLLEAIVFPSSSIVPEFRSYEVTTRKGRVVRGIIRRESTAAVYLRTAELTEVRIARRDVEEVKPSSVSLMPEGLEKTMTRQELSDLLAFLLSLR
jgi:putative heme-binding domain-containing protein